MREGRQHQRGLTLIELMVSIAIGLFIVLVAYAVAVAANNVMHGGELVISIIAGIAVAAAAFAAAFFIAGPIALALLTLFTYAIERMVRTR